MSGGVIVPRVFDRPLAISAEINLDSESARSSDVCIVPDLPSER